MQPETIPYQRNPVPTRCGRTTVHSAFGLPPETTIALEAER